MTENPLDIRNLAHPIVAIVSYRHDVETMGPDVPRAGKFYQVTIARELLSGAGDFIRFGRCHGDEINGWQHVEELVIEEVLTEYLPGQPLPLIDAPTVEIQTLAQVMELSANGRTQT